MPTKPVTEELDKSQTFAVYVRQCLVTNAIETKLFGTVKFAMEYAEHVHGLKKGDFEPYLIESDPESKMKYNDDPVSYCGWQAYIDETGRIIINQHCRIVGF